MNDMNETTLNAACVRAAEGLVRLQSRHDGIGTLVTDDLGHVLERQRLHIDFIGNLHVGLDRRR